MTILQFMDTFRSEQDCIDYIRDLRLKQGITCKRCNEKTKHYWVKYNNKFQCSVCRSRTNIKSGTIMEKSKISIRVWLTAIHFISTIKKSFSALELQKHLGISCYETVWYMLHKIRIIMGKRDEKYLLDGDIEIDGGHYEVVNDEFKRGKTKLKSGQGSQRQAKVLVMVESKPVEHDLKHKKKRVLGYVKMSYVDSFTIKSINYEVQKSICKTATVYTDKHKGFNRLSNVVKKHYSEVVKKEDAMKKLPWVHTIISNSKKMTAGIHHSVNKKYIQNYLNEFCYKLNRRNFKHRDMFDGLALACIEHSWAA